MRRVSVFAVLGFAVSLSLGSVEAVAQPVSRCWKGTVSTVPNRYPPIPRLQPLRANDGPQRLKPLSFRSGFGTTNLVPLRRPEEVMQLLLAFVAAQAPAAAEAGVKANEGYADLPGVRIWYEDTGGSGVPVVFLHASTGSSRNWEYQIPAFTAAGYRFIAYDRRGWGRTVSDPANGQPGTAADDLQALMDYLHIDRFHLVATASGGSVSLDYAVSFQRRLRSLVLADAAGGDVQDAEYQAMARRIRPAQFDALPSDFRELGPSYRAANPEGTRRWLELEHMSRQKPPAPAQATKNKLTFPLLETIRVPTLLLTGDGDLYAPPPFLRFLTARIKNSETVVVPESGHSSYWEQPEIFNRTVLEFIRKH
jgi:pimeloyl-ACP methyl ester carboxylesterase